jgi:hypothetical protein
MPICWQACTKARVSGCDVGVDTPSGPPVPWCGPASVSLSSLRRNSGSTSR